MGTQEEVIVVVPNYNGLKMLGTRLFENIDSIFTINYANFKVIIVDNNSSDGSYERLLDRYRGDAILIRLPYNYGYAGGIEFGLKHYIIKVKKTPMYAVLLNNDYKITNPDFVKELLKHMDSEPSVAVAQGINLIYGTSFVESAGSFITNTPIGSWRFHGMRLNEVPDLPSYVSYADGACLMVKLKPIILLQGYIFNPYLFAYFEDVELSFKSWSLGLKVSAYPVVVGEHLGSATHKRASILKRYLLTRNEHIILRSYFSGKARIILLPKYINSFTSLLYRCLYGEKGRLITRGIIDGLLFQKRLKIKQESSYSGQFYPLIFNVNIREWIFHSMPAGFRRTILRRFTIELEHIISRMTVDREMLKKSTQPFILKLNYKPGYSLILNT